MYPVPPEGRSVDVLWGGRARRGGFSQSPRCLRITRGDCCGDPSTVCISVRSSRGYALRHPDIYLRYPEYDVASSLTVSRLHLDVSTCLPMCALARAFLINDTKQPSNQLTRFLRAPRPIEQLSANRVTLKEPGSAAARMAFFSGESKLRARRLQHQHAQNRCIGGSQDQRKRRR